MTINRVMSNDYKHSFATIANLCLNPEAIRSAAKHPRENTGWEIGPLSSEPKRVFRVETLVLRRFDKSAFRYACAKGSRRAGFPGSPKSFAVRVQLDETISLPPGKSWATANGTASKPHRKNWLATELEKPVTSRSSSRRTAQAWGCSTTQQNIAVATTIKTGIKIMVSSKSCMYCIACKSSMASVSFRLWIADS